ncbi:MAG: methylated-DNA--[protein]-cysteine S-methyltransferase [Oscillospiraceae bacterium]|jgi:methylated-DNA-[protein]-cysteine S-methyltransferase|nr:methylated-DNA--[protein]-cysteine S-methyltransferase [Oscillospiraceae bacterium]
MSIAHAAYASPMGTLHLYARDNCIIRLDFAQSAEAARWFDNYFTKERAEEGSPPVIAALARELDEYFAGRRTVFTVPYRLYGTEYRQSVWRALAGIPYGEAITYGELARRVGTPKAARAVGGANHHNPISIVVPCHRVVGADGGLTGYGGGIERKAFLLKLENAR